MKIKKYNIYLPPDYYQSNKNYPVVYLFHGAGGNQNDWVDHGVDEILDNLIANNLIQPMIVVMPDTDDSALENGCSGFSGSDPTTWVDYGASCGDYEDYIVDDLINHIDSDYRTTANKYHRATNGLCNGAHGAIWIATRNPDLFVSASGHSGYYAGSLASSAIEVTEDLDLNIYFDTGKFDIFTIFEDNKNFHSMLTENGIQHTYNKFDGTHSWDYWVDHIDESLIFHSENFS